MRVVGLALVLMGCPGTLTPHTDSPGKDVDLVDGVPVDTGELTTDDTDDTDPPLDTDDTDPPVDTGTLTSGFVCPDDVFAAVQPSVLAGSTRSQGDDAAMSCGGAGADDVHLEFTAPVTTRYRFSLTATFDAVLTVLDGCAGPELICVDEVSSETAVLQLLSGQRAVVVVDGVGTAEGDYTVTIDAVPDNELDCTDGIDDDEDGQIDCADNDCASGCGETCNDGTDNDLDGLTDCADSECFGHPTCAEVCNDSTDNDFDGLTDCADSDCSGHPSCAEACNNGTDDDFDGLTDCADPDCVGTGPCTEACNNGVDDDLDGLTDCLDPECIGLPVCTEDCDDGNDDDLDGLVDCLDVGDCASDPDCVAPCSDGTFLPPLPDAFIGNTTLAVGDFDPGCVANSNAPDFEFDFVAPATGLYTFDTVGSAFDTVIYALDGCAGVELACNDDTTGLQSEITVPMTIGQRIIVVVDGYGTASGAMTVTAN